MATTPRYVTELYIGQIVVTTSATSSFEELREVAKQIALNLPQTNVKVQWIHWADGNVTVEREEKL